MRSRSPSLAAAVAAFALLISCTEQLQNPGAPTEPTLAKGGPGVKSVNVTPSSASIAVNGTVQLTATASPPKAATNGFTWSTTNAAVATVSSSGLVTGVSAGTATIRATSGAATGASTITVTTTPPPSNDPVLVGAGDIAKCSVTGDEATANLLDNIAGTVFTLGDNVYDSGTATEYTNCYGPSWGRHRSRTAPTPGNHEYNTPNATGYYGYFGSAAGDPNKGYYSYDLGNWHIIVLNSNSSCTTISCAAGSAQDTWLRADLAAHTNVCTLAYWHHPRFNSGAAHGNNTAVSNFWDALYLYGADVVLNGHEHVYERFAPQTPGAVADPTNGIRQFTVGTGGASHYTFGTIKANSQVREGNTYGVLKLTLHATSYDWQFVPVAGATFTDSGTGNCH
ncbi:MAG TPA: Ig-like domain-containing protein [Gemmatimonadaceae bacterium]|nr:Ig-like domain-containing protein [Gemmatimonadaceae bacterium]